MFGLYESLARLAAHALCRRIGRDSFRMFGLNPLKLVHQHVEVSVRDLRIVQHVIAIFVMPNLLAQSFNFLFDFFIWVGTGHDWEIIVRAVLLSTGSWLFCNWQLVTGLLLFESVRVQPCHRR